MTTARGRRWVAPGALFYLIATIVLYGCAKPPAPEGFRAGVAPGVSRAKIVQLLGKPSQAGGVGVSGTPPTDLMAYPFGQILLQKGRAVAVTIASDASYVGPYGIKLGMAEDKVKAALAAHRKPRQGHMSSYTVTAGTMDTRSRDLYDVTDGLVIEMAAANAIDPLASFNVVSISLVNPDGARLLSGMTKAKLTGLNASEHVYNFVDEPWSTR
ncbi:MAG: hypothetical protein GIW99_08880 [Candidatus Eremiobacteraeota bacterium]|nr:hypothetical protein [Candidatus Eremiobacteraeota bacterium]MBC5827777.1 hypothetical protein [Candidatus Eremiobacteraeota bacterium]